MFITRTNHMNPPGNKIIFEEYFFDRFTTENPHTNRLYVPVLWTNYYIANGYKGSEDLQRYLYTLRGKYFTIVQWDDGILENTDHLDLFKFASGGVGDYSIPLNCQFQTEPYHKDTFERQIFASFIGTIIDRHPIRMQMYHILSSYKDVVINQLQGHPYQAFADVMKSSVFALCPRGYGKTSFRITEALHYGAIPVYIYNDDWTPFSDLVNFETYGVKCHESELGDLYDRLKSIQNNEKHLKTLQDYGKKVYRDFFTYDGCYTQIIKKLEAI